MTLGYIYSKFFKKIVRWKSICRSRIDKTAIINTGTTITDSIMGRYSYCGYDCEINQTEIGAFCSISDHVFIGGSEHPINWISTSPVFQNTRHSGPPKRFATLEVPRSKTTIIGNDVWVGHGVSIKAGVKIGDGAVIGIGAVVTKDVPPYAVVIGIPAKIIRYRFDESTISALLNSKWWNLDDSNLRKVAPYINNTDLFLKIIENEIKG